jgi:hypothetical protein
MARGAAMKKPKLTKWFEESAKPVRDGVYERKRDGVFRYWLFMDGYWRYGGFINAESCVNPIMYRCALSQELPWRGLANNPEVK